MEEEPHTKTQRKPKKKLTPRHKDIMEKVEDNLFNDTKGKKKRKKSDQKI